MNWTHSIIGHDIVLDDQNGSFQNQSEEASTSKQSSRPLVSAWAELKRKKEISRKPHDWNYSTEHQQAEKRRKRGKLTIKDASVEIIDEAPSLNSRYYIHKARISASESARSGMNSDKASSCSADASFIVSLLLFLLFSACWCAAISVVRSPRGDFFFFKVLPTQTLFPR